MSAPSLPAGGDGEPLGDGDASLSLLGASGGAEGDSDSAAVTGVSAIAGKPPVSGDPSWEFGDVAPATEQGNDEKSARLLLTDVQRTHESLWATRIALEHARVVGAVDAHATATYASGVIDRSRLLAGSDARLHLRLLREHVAWLHSLPTGGGLLW